MRVAIIGDRGIPARYSGFSTLVEQLATRLVSDYGVEATVYCRTHYYTDHAPVFEGVRRVFLPAPGGKSLESVIHSLISVFHALWRRYDLVFVLDPGNAPLSLPLLLKRVPIVFHTDGLGWKRRKWSRLQQRYYKWSERVAARIGTWLVTDARAMQAYYRQEYRADSVFIPYSGAVGSPPSDKGLAEHGLEPGGFYLVVARLEPENNVDLIIREYLRSASDKPLVVVGGNPYGTPYSAAILAEPDPRVKALGGVFDSAILNGLYAACYAYIHGHEVGGTNPSLLRAMQAGAPCLGVDVVFTREVIGERGLFFTSAAGDLSRLIDAVDSDPAGLAAMGAALQERATRHYRWDAIADAYFALFRALIEARRGKGRIAAADVGEVYRPTAFPAAARAPLP